MQSTYRAYFERFHKTLLEARASGVTETMVRVSTLCDLFDLLVETEAKVETQKAPLPERVRELVDACDETDNSDPTSKSFFA